MDTKEAYTLGDEDNGVTIGEKLIIGKNGITKQKIEPKKSKVPEPKKLNEQEALKTLVENALPISENAVQSVQPKAEPVSKEPRYKVKYKLPGLSLTFSNQVIKKGENDLLLLIGHNSNEEQVLSLDKLGSAKPTECGIVAGVDCENPETFSTMICVDEIEIGDITYQIFLSAENLINIVKYVMSLEE